MDEDIGFGWPSELADGTMHTDFISEFCHDKVQLDEFEWTVPTSEAAKSSACDVGRPSTFNTVTSYVHIAQDSNCMSFAPTKLQPNTEAALQMVPTPFAPTASAVSIQVDTSYTGTMVPKHMPLPAANAMKGPTNITESLFIPTPSLPPARPLLPEAPTPPQHSPMAQEEDPNASDAGHLVQHGVADKVSNSTLLTQSAQNLLLSNMGKLTADPTSHALRPNSHSLQRTPWPRDQRASDHAVAESQGGSRLKNLLPVQQRELYLHNAKETEYDMHSQPNTWHTNPLPGHGMAGLPPAYAKHCQLSNCYSGSATRQGAEISTSNFATAVRLAHSSAYPVLDELDASKLTFISQPAADRDLGRYQVHTNLKQRNIGSSVLAASARNQFNKMMAAAASHTQFHHSDTSSSLTGHNHLHHPSLSMSAVANSLHNNQDVLASTMIKRTGNTSPAIALQPASGVGSPTLAAQTLDAPYALGTEKKAGHTKSTCALEAASTSGDVNAGGKRKANTAALPAVDTASGQQHKRRREAQGQAVTAPFSGTLLEQDPVSVYARSSSSLPAPTAIKPLATTSLATISAGMFSDSMWSQEVQGLNGWWRAFLEQNDFNEPAWALYPTKK